uniref:C2H2-type domain-containing protein n=1 Tax=Oryza barthii TaxID=65489 RepID=A0A0D3GFR1_9ORYZ
MSGCSWLCSLVILQAVCSACWQVAGANSLRLAVGQIGGVFVYLQDPSLIGYKGATPPLKMSSTPSSSSPVIPAGSPPPQPPPSSSSSLRPVGDSNSSMPTPGISLTTYEKLAACVMLTLRRRYDRDQRQLQAPPKLERAGAGDQLATNMVEGAEGSSRAIVRDEHEARRRKKGKRKLKEPREEERKVKKEKKRHPYMCKHCNEEFSTHQALGGHMAGHHKEKRILLKEKQRERSLVLEKEPERSHHLMEEKHPERGLILEKKQLERSSIVLKEKQPDKNLILEEEQPEVVYQDKIDQTMNWQKTERNEGASYLGGGSNTAPIAQEDSRPPFGFDLNVEAPEQE